MMLLYMPLAAKLEVHCFWQQYPRTSDPICKPMTCPPQQYWIDKANYYDVAADDLITATSVILSACCHPMIRWLQTNFLKCICKELWCLKQYCCYYCNIMMLMLFQIIIWTHSLNCNIICLIKKRVTWGYVLSYRDIH